MSDIQFLECQITKWGKEKFLLVTTAYKKKKKGWQIALYLLKCKINLCATLFFFSNVGLRLLVMGVQHVLETLLPFQKPSGMQ